MAGSLTGERASGVQGALLPVRAVNWCKPELKSIVRLDLRFLIGANFGGGIIELSTTATDDDLFPPPSL